MAENTLLTEIYEKTLLEDPKNKEILLAQQEEYRTRLRQVVYNPLVKDFPEMEKYLEASQRPKHTFYDWCMKLEDVKAEMAPIIKVASLLEVLGTENLEEEEDSAKSLIAVVKKQTQSWIQPEKSSLLSKETT